MRLWIDECLSPTLVDEAHRRGYEATCNRDRDSLGLDDRDLFARVASDGFALVTNDEGDFRRLCEAAGVHPGLIVLPQRPRADQRAMLSVTIDHIEGAAQEAGESARDFMVNRVVEIEDDETVHVFTLPS